MIPREPPPPGLGTLAAPPQGGWHENTLAGAGAAWRDSGREETPSDSRKPKSCSRKGGRLVEWTEGCWGHL